MKTKLVFLICITIICAATGILLRKSTSDRQVHELRKLKGEARFTLLERAAGKLKKGMAKSNVATVFGKPDNSDDTHVWLWTALETHDEKPILWKDVYNENGFFILFKDEKLISSLLKTTETTPWESFQIATGCSKADAELTLGPKPQIKKAE